MAVRSVEDLPLRELFTDADRLTRELIDHIDNGFIPKAQNLGELAEVRRGEVVRKDVDDITVRNNAAQLLESEDYAEQLYDRTQEYFAAINQAVSKITG